MGKAYKAAYFLGEILYPERISEFQRYRESLKASRVKKSNDQQKNKQKTDFGRVSMEGIVQSTCQSQGKAQTYSGTHRLRRFITHRPILRKITKDIAPAKQRQHPRKRMRVAKKLYTKPRGAMWRKITGQPWPGSSVSWSIVLYPERLWVRFPSRGTYGRQPINISLSHCLLSLSLPFSLKNP